MEDLLQPQIQENCKLALPEGLRDLMCDISREVLRAQPQNLCQFIANYLTALMVARDNLTIAANVCKGICECTCHPELDDELRYIGLDEEDAEEAKEIIMQHFESGKVKEDALLLKLMKKIEMDEKQLEAVQGAVRRAFKRHQLNNTTLFETSSSSEADDISHAAKHTLHLYRKTGPKEEQYHQVAERIQTSYRAYDVRRQKNQNNLHTNTSDVSDGSSNPVHKDDAMRDLFVAHNFKNRHITESLTSLAGSYYATYTKSREHSPVNTKDKKHVTLAQDEEFKRTIKKEELSCENLMRKKVRIEVTTNENTIQKTNVTEIQEVEFDISEEVDEVEKTVEIIEDSEDFHGMVDDEAVDADIESDASIEEFLHREGIRDSEDD